MGCKGVARVPDHPLSALAGGSGWGRLGKGE